MGTYLKESVESGITKKTFCKFQYEENIDEGILKGQIDTLILSLLHRRYMYGFELAKIVREENITDLHQWVKKALNKSAWNGNL